MKIGIIVHSRTGHTLSVAESLKTKLSARGFDVRLERISARNESDAMRGTVSLKSIPDISGYDAVIFCAWVMGGKLSPVMESYLSGLAGLSRKKAAILLTHFFPFKSWGGNQTILQTTRLLESKKAEVLGGGIVNWMGFGRKSRIDSETGAVAKLF